MATQRKKLSAVEKVLKLVDELTPKEQAEVQRRLNLKDWGKKWDRLTKRIRERNKGLPPLTEEEVAAEVTAYRREQRAKRAQSNR